MSTVIKYSQSFREFLEKKQETSVVARILYHAFKHDDDSFQSEKIPAYRLMITDKEINYLTFRNNGNISFLPAGKEHITADNGLWSKDNRQEGKPGKVIRKLFTEKALKIIPAKEFEQFTNQYKAEFNEDGYTFEILPNTRINEVYNNLKRKEGGAGLNQSCMNRNSEHRKNDTEGMFLELYAMCDNLKIITLTTRSGQLCGRALLWMVDGIQIMDRIYVSDDFMYDMFLNYASDNGMWRKRNYKSYERPKDFIDENGNTINRAFTIKTDTEFNLYPYIDTFRYGNDGWLSNDDESGYRYQYHYADGEREDNYKDKEETDDYDDDTMHDEINDINIDRDDAIEIERGRYRGQWTHMDNTVEVNGYTWWNRDDDIVNLSWDNEWYRVEDVVYSERDCEDYPKDDCRQVGGDWVLKEDTVRDYNGDWQHKDDCTLLDNGDFAIEDDWVLTDDGRKILEIYSVEIDGKYYHEDDPEIQPDYTAPTEVLCKYLAPFEKPNVNQLKFELCEKD